MLESSTTKFSTAFEASAPRGALVIQDEEEAPTLILFTALERAKEFLANFTGFGSVLTEFKRVLEKIDQDLSIVINPGLDFGIDLEPANVAELRRRAKADA